jgi:hypothetical protein
MPSRSATPDWRGSAAAAHDRTVPNRQLAVQLTGWTLRNFQQAARFRRQPGRHSRPSTLEAESPQGLLRTRPSFAPATATVLSAFLATTTRPARAPKSLSKYHETGTSRLPQRAACCPRNETVAIGYAVQLSTSAGPPTTSEVGMIITTQDIGAFAAGGRDAAQRLAGRAGYRRDEWNSAEPTNEDPSRCPWIGVYPLRTPFPPRSLGSGRASGVRTTSSWWCPAEHPLTARGLSGRCSGFWCRR